MKNNVIYTLLGMLILMLSSCYYDIQEELHPGAYEVCDTAAITYEGKITQILQRSCVSCHSQNAASANIKLDNYADVKIVADNGKLTGTIDHQSGYSPMPQNLPQLSECDRSTIKKWIQNGTTNN